MNNSVQTIPEMKAIHDNPSSHRGAQWFALLSHGFTKQNAIVPSLLVADGEYENRACRLIAVVPDLNNHFPRAVNGEVGLLEGMALAREVNAVVEADAHSETKRALVLIVDVPSQAYGRREETLGIHQALASAVSAYANARQNDHPIIALLVGKAMSGAYLAHGYQANRIIALSDEGVMVHAMGKAAAARVTQRTEAELDQLAHGAAHARRTHPLDRGQLTGRAGGLGQADDHAHLVRGDTAGGRLEAHPSRDAHAGDAQVVREPGDALGRGRVWLSGHGGPWLVAWRVWPLP